MGDVAIISGGLGDIGRAIALALAKRGASIGLSDIRDPADAESFLKSLRDLGIRARYDRVDVSNADQVKHWIAAVEADLGVANWIMPNAAQVTLETVRTITPEQWRR